MKKFILILISLALFPTQSVLALYDDVSESTTYYDEIKYLYENDKLAEEPDNLFHPDQLLTKAFIYKAIISYARIPLSTEINLPYSDISKEADYSPYIQTALDLKIIKPSGLNSIFEPDLPLSKYNALLTLFEGLGLGVSPFVDKDFFPFSDVSATSYIAPVAKKAHDLSILEVHEEKFNMGKRITKATLAHYLYQIEQNLKNGDIPTIEVILTNSSSETLEEEELLENEKFADFADIWSALKNNYLYTKEENIDGDKLLSDAIEGMLKNIKDSYTTYEKPDEKYTILDSISSEYEGIGIIIDVIDDQITIITPIKNSPAELSGLKSGDIITAVNDEDISDQSLSEVSSKIKGKASTIVKITVKRENQKLDFDVTRAFVLLKTTNHEILTSPKGKKVAYIELLTFADQSYSEFLLAAEELITKEPAGFIIDLRNNGGGYVDTAINIISLFTDEEKPIVTFVYADNKKEKLRSTGAGLLKDYKIVVLINEASASASEIMAGALQDWGSATVIGQKSFGKGSVQELRAYNDGSVFKFTTSKWLTPNYRDISKEGIAPDETVSNVGSAVDLQLEKALEKF